MYMPLKDRGLLENFREQQRILDDVSKQTRECLYFIRKYLKDKESFGVSHHMSFTDVWRLNGSCAAKRAIKNAVTSDDAIIEDFQSQFNSLRNSFYEEATRQTQLMVVRIQDKLEDSGESTVLMPDLT
jgi:predicted methyltransferase